MDEISRSRWLRLVLLVLAVNGVIYPTRSEDGAEGVSNAMNTQLAADLAVIHQRRILFLHHSVGVNVLQGMKRLDDELGGGELRIVEFEKAAAQNGPVLFHGGGGRNTEPKSKIDSFADLIRREPRLKPDLAFMKLCYVDFNPQTDVEDLISYYRRTLESLKSEHPEIRFAHVTVPLFKWPTDLKQSLRRLFGLEVWEDTANVKRAEYNRRLTETFASDPVFDLARAEATGSDGSQSSFVHHGQTYPSLHARYTDDGGHLNSSGQRATGAAAIHFLADALRVSPMAP